MFEIVINRPLGSSTNIIKINNVINPALPTSTPNAPAITDLSLIDNTTSVDLTFTKPANTTVKAYKSDAGSSNPNNVHADDVSSPLTIGGLTAGFLYAFKVTTRGNGNGTYNASPEVNSNIVTRDPV